MRLYYIIISFLMVLLLAFTSEEEAFLYPKKWPKPNYDFKNNPLQKKRIELGRALFYDPILSADSTISCASCHSPYNAFTHVDHALSHGINDIIGKRNSPVLINLAWEETFMWDGAVQHLDFQALSPISNPDEMNENLAHVITKLQQQQLYLKLVEQAFGSNEITGEIVLKALSQFMLTLISANSKYDKVMRREALFTSQEKKGYLLFRMNCASCHPEPLFTNHKFENNGLKIDSTLNDYGRYGISHESADSLKFKVPTLRNIEYSYPYMHDGRFKTLQEVIKHYTHGIEASPTLSPHLKKGIRLEPNERIDLIAFLLTLSDKEFVFNPNYSYPKYIFFPNQEGNQK